MARGASAAPGRPPLRRTPSSWGKPISTGRPRISAGPPDHSSTHSPRRGSSGRAGGPAGGGVGSSSEDHPAALDDAPDMVHPEVVKQVAVVRPREDDEVGLLADGQRAEAVAA